MERTAPRDVNERSIEEHWNSYRQREIWNSFKGAAVQHRNGVNAAFGPPPALGHIVDEASQCGIASTDHNLGDMWGS